MKPFQKVLAALLAAVLIVSAAGCMPMSLNKEWSYKYSDKTLDKQYDIGVYIYSLYQAYNSAKTYAEKSDKYKDNEPFMDIEITDDDNKKAVAKDWIKKEADKISMNLVALDYLCAKDGATWDEAAMTSAKETAQNTWDMGPYASYGYFQPQKDELQKFGISFESFNLSVYEANVKQTALFKKLYDKGGLEEVKDSELASYIKKEYTGYSYIPVHLYTSSTDADNNSTSTKFDAKKTKKVTGELEDYAKAISNGSKKFSDVLEAAKKDYGVSDSDVKQDQADTADNIKSDNEDVYNALQKMKNGEAKVVTVGADGDSPIAYVVVKNELTDKFVNNYVADENNHSTVLSNMKKDDLTDLLEKTADELKKSSSLSVNEGAINSYDPGMFFVKAEETTAADASDDESSDDDSSAE